MSQSENLPDELEVEVCDFERKGVVFQGRLDTTDDDNVISQAALERLSLQSSVAPDSNHSGSIGEVTLYFELKGAKNGTSSYHESFHVVKEVRHSIVLGNAFKRNYDDWVQKKRLAPIRTKKQSPDEKREQEERDRVANAQQKTDEAAEKKKRREDRDKHRQSSKKSGGKSSKGSG